MKSDSDSSDDDSGLANRKSRMSYVASKRPAPDPPEIVYERKERMHQLLSTVQGISPYFCGLTYSEARFLVEMDYLEVITAANNELVIEAGTTPAWFGVLCHGSLVYMKELSKQVRSEVWCRPTCMYR